MRKLHRWLMTTFVVFVLYLGITGLLTAIYDYTDAQQVWAADGGGPGMREAPDIDGQQPLPDTEQLAQVLGTVLPAAQARGPFTLVSMRLANGALETEISGADGQRLNYDVNGLALGVAAPPAADAGGRREQIKGWHRAAFLGSFGRYAGALCAAALCLIVLSGVVLYFQMMDLRTVHRGGWRGAHRMLSIFAAAFVLNTAVTGMLLNCAELLRHWRGLDDAQLSASSQPLPAGDLRPLLRNGIAAASAIAPLHTLSSVSIGMYGGQPRLQAGFAAPGAGTISVNAVTGARLPGPPAPTGRGVPLDDVQFLKRLHRGDFAGDFHGRLLSLFGGICLVFLCLSALFMYFSMLDQRRRRWQYGFYWH
jgi:uncharacterized iron-regulated membrane protein